MSSSWEWKDTIARCRPGWLRSAATISGQIVRLACFPGDLAGGPPPLLICAAGAAGIGGCELDHRHEGLSWVFAQGQFWMRPGEWPASRPASSGCLSCRG